MFAKDPLNQKFSGLISAPVRDFIVLAAFNSLLLVLLGKTQPIWPQMDNLSGAKNFLATQSDDYYTNSLFNSPRLFTIAILKMLALLFHSQVEAMIAILGVLINICGAPLFILAVNKKITETKNSKSGSVTVVATLILLTILNMDFLHNIEVNGFYINPFSQGATTSNLAIVIFLAGVVSERKIVRATLIIFSLLLHVSSFFYLLILFVLVNNSKSWKSHLRHAPIIWCASLILTALAILKMENVNGLGWKYYVENRASNHFVISTSSPQIFTLVLWSLLGFAVVFNSTLKSKRYALTYLGIAAVSIFCSAYHFYALPFAIAFVCLALDIQARVVVLTSLSLLILFFLQNSPIEPILIAASILVPATRYVSIVTLYLSIILLFGICTKLSTIFSSDVICTNTPKLPKRLIALSVVTTLVCTILSSGAAIKNFTNLRSTISSFSFKDEIAKKDLIFLDVSSQGWREFGGYSIFVDDYPFWGNLNEYRKRSIFRSDLESLVEKRLVSSEQLKSLQLDSKFRQEIILVTSKRNAHNLNNLSCLYRDEFVLCELGARS